MMKISLLFVLYSFGFSFNKITLPEELYLIGNQGEVISRKSVENKRLLFVSFDEFSLEALVKAKFCHDIASSGFKCIFLFKGEVWTPTLDVKLKDLNVFHEIFFDINNHIRVEFSPSFQYFGLNHELSCKRYGFVEAKQVYQWALSDFDLQNQPAFTLGNDGVIMQESPDGCAAAATAMLLSRLNLAVPKTKVFERLDPGTNRGLVSLLDIKNFLSSFNIRSRAQRISFADLKGCQPPGILHLRDQHYVVLVGFFGEGAVILNPSSGRQYVNEDFLKMIWSGVFFWIDGV